MSEALKWLLKWQGICFQSTDSGSSIADTVKTRTYRERNCVKPIELLYKHLQYLKSTQYSLLKGWQDGEAFLRFSSDSSQKHRHTTLGWTLWSVLCVCVCVYVWVAGYHNVLNIEILTLERPSSLLSPFALPTPVDEPALERKSLFLRCLRRNMMWI